MTTNLKTIQDFTRFAMTEFEKQGVTLGHGAEDFWQEATFLVLRSLNLPFDRLESFWEAHLTEEECALLLKRIHARTIEKVPTAYILGEAWLMGMKFRVNENVLIPRSFIAELLENGLSPWIHNPEKVNSVLDMCTGSGCLAIMAKDAFPNATVVGADISPKALEVARENVSDYGLNNEVEIVESNAFANLGDRCFEVIICNPPYVTKEAMEKLPSEYRKEPLIALDAGEDGMDFLKNFIPELSRHLVPNGEAYIEIGDGKEAFEALWPRLSVMWLETSGGDSMVFRVTREDLKGAGL